MITIGHRGSERFPQPAGLEVILIRRLAAKRLVRSRGAVKVGVSLEPGSRIGDRVVGIQVDVLHPQPDTASQRRAQHQESQLLATRF